VTTPRAVDRLFIVLIALVSVYRLTLLDRGAGAFVDETHYFTSVMTLQSLAAGNVHQAVANIAVARGRHGATLVQLPVALLQSIPAHFGIPASNPRSLLIPAVCNVLVTAATLYFFFGIAAVACGDPASALIATLVYGLLVNTNLYVRHMLPYDWALCAGMAALWFDVTRRPSAWRPAWSGLLIGVMVTVYTGYYVLAAVVGVAVVGHAWQANGWRGAVRAAAVFAAASGAVVIVMELIFRAGGLSYIGALRTQSRDITFTSLDEGWLFLPRYLVDVERLSGVVLIGAVAVYLWQAARRAHRGAMRAIDCLVLPAIGGCVWQAAASALMHSVPLYGRLIHPWMPFLAWALADVVASIERPAFRTIARATIVLAVALSWLPAARAYYRLAYPATILYSLGIDTARLPPNRMLCELSPGSSYASPAPLDRVTGYPYSSAANYQLVNFCQALPSIPRPRRPAAVSAGATLVYDGPHWMTFPAYAFEGLTPGDRAAMAAIGYRVRVFVVPIY
jgi:hypothetical protein